jgi:tetratricopeptide (TPR) repeat protein
VSRSRIGFSRLAAAVVLFASLPGTSRAAAQTTPACQTPECVSRDQLWVPAARIHEIKNQFVAAIRQFTEAVAGTYGDEGPRLSTTLDAARRSLAQWDAAIRAYETMVASLTAGAEVHVALGTVYLDRDRIDDALREFGAAGRLDPRRADVHSLSGLAHALANSPLKAAAELRTASMLNADDPLLQYGLAQQLLKADRRGPATDALRRFQESAWPRLRRARGSQPSAPFERVSLLRQVAGVAPIFPLDAYRSGFAALVAGRYDAALTELGRAVSADPLAGSGPGDVSNGGAALRRGQLPPALKALEDGVAANPDRSESHRVLGLAYWADEQLDKSVAQLTEAIRRAPLDERSRLLLADVLSDAGRSAEAEQALTAAIAAIPGSGQAHYRLGLLYQSHSLLPQAVREFEAAAALGPLVGLDRLYETIGAVYASQASFDNAVAAYLKRIEVNPNNADAHKSLGEIYFLQGRHDEALAEFAATLLIDPGHAGALVGASQVFLRLGRFDEALDLSAQALALDGRLKDARYAHAMSLVRSGRADEGRRELELFERMQAEVMATTERQSELNTLKRDAVRRLEGADYVAAATLLRQATALDPGAADVSRDLGSALLLAGRPGEAASELERSIQLEDSAGAHRLLADAYKALGRPADGEAQTALAAQITERAKAARLQKLGGVR